MAALDFMMPRRLQRVLGALLLNQEKEFSLSDLIRIGGDGRGATQVVVNNLFGAGVVTDRRVGNQRLFKANTAHPLLPELRSMALKTSGLAEPIREALTPLADRIELAFVFGSMVSGKERPDSDIDLMLVGEVDMFDAAAALEAAERTLARPIHVNVHSSEEWAGMRDDRVVSKIATGPKIMVFGHEPEREPERPRLQHDQDRQ